MIFRCGFILLLVSPLMAASGPKNKHAKKREAVKVIQAQTQPTPGRIAEIQAALTAHGYDPGTTWAETQEICRRIADEHQWQTDHAPDVRVLILLGLGGPQSDPTVTQKQGGRLDQIQRAEAARRNQFRTTSESASDR